MSVFKMRVLPHTDCK